MRSTTTRRRRRGACGAVAPTLTGATAHGGWTCDIDFDDDGAIALLPSNAVDTFA